MDNNYRVKTYPRTTDPVYNNNITIGSVTTNTITLPIGLLHLLIIHQVLIPNITQSLVI